MKKKQKIETWPDGRAKKWYAVFSQEDGTVLEDSYEACIKCIKKLLKEDPSDMYKLVEVISHGGWQTEKDDTEETVAIYTEGKVFVDSGEI